MLSEFQRSPFFKGMTTNCLTLTSSCVTGYISPRLYPVTQEEAGANLYIPTHTSILCRLESATEMPAHLQKEVFLALEMQYTSHVRSTVTDMHLHAWWNPIIVKATACMYNIYCMVGRSIADISDLGAIFTKV